MKKELIQKFLHALGRPKSEVHGHWVQCSCLFEQWKHKGGKDTHPSFGVKIKDGKSHYNCFSCGSYGSLEDLLLELIFLTKQDKDPDLNFARAYDLLDQEAEAGYLDAGEYKEFDPPQDQHNYVPWPEWWLASFPLAKHVPLAWNYLESRGFPMEMVDTYDVRYDHSKNAVCFPIRSITGDLVGMRGRFLIPVNTGGKELRYWDYDWQDYNNTKWVYYGEHEDMFQKPIVLVEGIFDVVSVRRVYSNVLSPMSVGTSPSKIKRLAFAPKIVCFFDNDAAGYRAYKQYLFKLAETLPVVNVEYPDDMKNEKGDVIKDAGEMTIEQVKQVLGTVELI